MTYRLLVAFLAIAQALSVTPVRSEQTLWVNPIEQVFFSGIVQACKQSVMFGINPWTGFIDPISDYRRLDFECSWSNPFGGGPKFDAWCRRNDGTYDSGPCTGTKIAKIANACTSKGNDEASQTPNGQQSAGNPASLSSGQKYEMVTDWTSPKDSRFRFVRNYRTNFSVDRDMGLVWQSNWSDQLRLLWPQIKWRLVRSNGDWHEFVDQDGAWGPTGDWQPTEQDTTITLTQNGGLATLTHGDGMIEIFQERGAGGTYLYSELSSREWPDGYRIDIAYDADGYITTIADNRGQTAYVTWVWPWNWGPGDPYTGVGKHIDYIDIDYDDPATTTPSLRIDYSYTGTGGEILPLRMSGVTVQDLGTSEIETIATYDYYDIYHDAYLKTVIDGKAVSYGNFNYSNVSPYIGNMVSSNHPGGADQTTISYDSAYQSTVTNALGRSTVYNFVDVLNVEGRRISTIDGVATANCLATTQALSYTPAPAGAPHGYVYERVNRNGSVTRYERDSRGLVTKLTEDALGLDPRITLKEWHPTLHLPTRITTSHMEEVFSYDAAGLLLTYTQTDILPGSPSNAESRTWTFTYQTLASGLTVLSQLDGPGLVVEGVTDVTTYSYDANGVLQTTTTPTGLITEIVTVNSRGQPTLIRQPDGVETAFTYDFRGRLKSTTRDPSGAAATTSFIYDAIGQITSMTLPEGGVWSYSYDDARRLTQVENPAGDKILYSHDLVSNVTHTEYQNATAGVFFSFDQQFDELGRILATVGAQTQTWQFAHDVEDNLDLVTDPLGNMVDSGFDALNRLVQLTDEANEVTAMDYDENDAVISYTDPRGLETTTQYNGFGEVISEVSPDRGTITYTYESRGLVETVTDGRGVIMIYSYDDDGRLTARGSPGGGPIDTPAAPQVDSAYDAESGTTYAPGSAPVNDLNTAAEENEVVVQPNASYYWDIGFADADPALGTPTQVLVSLQYRRQNGWKGTFRAEYRVGAAVLATVDLPVSGNQLNQYAWDLSAEVQDIADLNGGTLRLVNLATGNKTMRVSHAALNAILTKPGAPSGGDSFVWGTAGLDAGKLTLITDESGTTTRSHDAQGRIASETRTIGGVGFDIGYGYDDEDLLTLVTYPSGREVQYVRNLAGEITAVRQRPDSVSPWEDVATAIDWLPFGDIATMMRGNGILYDAAYDTSYRMTGQTETDIAALRDVLYGYSLRDNLTSAGDLLDPAQDVSYSYDARQMLDGSTGPWGALGYTYDPVGNRATRSLTPPGGSASLDTYTYELTSNGLDTIDNLATGTRGYSYDGAGNTVGELRALAVTDNWSYAYNNAGRLASVSLNGGLQAEYVYNALGQQVSRTVGSGPSAVVTLSVHDLNGNRIAEHDDTGAVIREYIWLDGRPLAVVEGGQLYQLHWDQIMRPVMATDSTGAVVWAASYLPFGGIDLVWVDTGVLEQNLRFPGQWFQAETGLHQNWMRDYDPTTGRYLQADPLGLVDGPSVYGYARQGPVRYVDPTGLTLATNARFFMDWVFGLGPRNRNYGPNDIETQEMAQGAGAEELRDEFYEKLCRNVDAFAYGTFEAYRDTIYLPWDTTFQVGGWAGATAVNNGNGTVTFKIPNTAGTRSFFLHLPRDRRSLTGVMSNIDQVFEWTEPIDFTLGCGCE